MDTSFIDKITFLKNWLHTGSINIFGLPMSGKDTVGAQLADALEGELLSSGAIIRAMESTTKQHFSDKGKLTPTDVFYDWVLPYFDKPEFKDSPLILSSIGRWSGEEDAVMASAKASGHELKSVVLLDISEAKAIERREAALASNSRGPRADDSSIDIFKTRLKEFYEKTMPVIRHYEQLGLLIKIDGNGSRDKVFENVIDELWEKASKNQSNNS